MTITRLSIFPLPGALLFPGMHLPLHIFEPRYRAMVNDSLARDRRIAMIQPKGGGEKPPLFEIGCVGRIADVEAMEDGRFNVVLEGLSRFRILRELEVTTLFRQVEAELIADPIDETLSMGARAALELESRRFAEVQGYAVDWEAVARLDDQNLVNGIAQIAPFDPAAKQILLEADDLNERADRIIQLMQIVGRAERDGGATMQ